jgi:hypothetical protein
MDKLREIDWRGLAKTATQKVKKYTLNLTDLEIKVEDATNSETWGEPAAGLLRGRPGPPARPQQDHWELLNPA